MSKIKINSVKWNYSNFNNLKIKSSAIEAELSCECGQIWTWQQTFKAVDNKIKSICPNCKEECVFERAEFADL
jgi:Zn finger protein HypA/HybF involved in hydrogenase expression